MADDTRSSSEIEREIEQERAELRGTIDGVFTRLTFQDAWMRVGNYMRDNRSDLGQTLGHVIKEKPIAVDLTALGVAWLLFGPSSGASGSRRQSSYSGHGDVRGPNANRGMLARSRLGEGDFDDMEARGPSAPDAKTDPWSAPKRTPSSAAASTSGSTSSAAKSADPGAASLGHGSTGRGSPSDSLGLSPAGTESSPPTPLGS